MKIFIVTAIYLALLFTSCNKDDLSQMEKIADQVMNRVIEKIQKKYETSLTAFGGKMMGQINSMYLSFEIRKPLDIEEARKIIVDAVLIMKEEIDNDREIRPFLAEFPFPVSRIDLSFSIGDDQGHRRKYPALTLVSSINGTVYYKAYEMESVKGFKILQTETFEEALDHLQEK